MSNNKKLILHIALAIFIGVASLLSMTSFGSFLLVNDEDSITTDSITPQDEKHQFETGFKTGYERLVYACENGIKQSENQLSERFNKLTFAKGIDAEIAFSDFSGCLFGKKYTGRIRYISVGGDVYLNGEISSGDNSPIDLSVLKSNVQTSFFSDSITDGTAYSFENKNYDDFISDFTASQLYKNCGEGDTYDFIERMYLISVSLERINPNGIKEAFYELKENIDARLKEEDRITVNPLAEGNDGYILRFSFTSEELFGMLKPVIEMLPSDVSEITKLFDTDIFDFSLKTDSMGKAESVTVETNGFSLAFDFTKNSLDIEIEGESKKELHLDGNGFTYTNTGESVNEIVGEFHNIDSEITVNISFLNSGITTNEITVTYSPNESAFTADLVSHGGNNDTTISTAGKFKVTESEISISFDGIGVSYGNVTAKDDFDFEIRIKSCDVIEDSTKAEFSESSELFALKNLESRRLKNLLNERISDIKERYGDIFNSDENTDYSDYSLFPIIK